MIKTIDNYVQSQWDYLVNHFTPEYIEHMSDKKEYVLGFGNGNNSFCYIVEVALRSLGEIRGANSSKFGLWYGVKGKDKNIGYKATKKTFNNDPDLAFEMIKPSLANLIRKAKSLTEYHNIEFLIDGMFKNKIIYLYNPDIMIPSFVEQDLHHFEKQLGIGITSTFEDAQRQLVSYRKNMYSDMSNHQFGCFLYEKYGKHNEKEIMDFNESCDDILNKSIGKMRKPKNPYVSQPQPRLDAKETKSGVGYYPRDPKMALYALMNAEFKCENNIDHYCFLRKRNKRPYTEVHHLIPLCYYEDFNVSLDVPENIVSLCSNCHNEIHYGLNQDDIIEKLYNERSALLQSVGIVISLKRLLEMYHEINKKEK